MSLNLVNYEKGIKNLKSLINNIYIYEIMFCQHIKINVTFLKLTKKFIVMYLFHMILNGASLVYGIWLQAIRGNKINLEKTS